MTTQLVIDLAKRIHEIDSRVSAYPEGGLIKGCFRGKKNENYTYLVTAREFTANNAPYAVEKAINQAIGELIPPK